MWLPTSHTSAFFGYTIYFVIGVRLRRSYPALMKWIARQSVFKLMALVIATFLLSVSEAKYLSSRSTDILNTLRISNQLYSIAILFLIFKIKYPLYPSAMNVRRYTFGIYLIHPLFVTLVSSGMASVMARLYGAHRDRLLANPHYYIHSELTFVAVWLFCFTLVYGLSWFVSALIAGSRSATAIGMVPERHEAGQLIRVT